VFKLPPLHLMLLNKHSALLFPPLQRETGVLDKENRNDSETEMWLYAVFKDAKEFSI